MVVDGDSGQLSISYWDEVVHLYIRFAIRHVMEEQSVVGME